MELVIEFEIVLVVVVWVTGLRDPPSGNVEVMERSSSDIVLVSESVLSTLVSLTRIYCRAKASSIDDELNRCQSATVGRSILWKNASTISSAPSR